MLPGARASDDPLARGWPPGGAPCPGGPGCVVIAPATRHAAAHWAPTARLWPAPLQLPGERASAAWRFPRARTRVVERSASPPGASLLLAGEGLDTVLLHLH